MAKKKESRRTGIMSKKETQFLFWSEEQKKKFVPKDATRRKHYQRITEGANKAFQDLDSMIVRLPPKQLEKIEFELGLNTIHKNLAKKHLTKRLPHQVIETARLSLEDSLKIIAKNYNQKLASIAESDFDLVKDWLDMAQKYPKPGGAQTGI